MVQINQRIKKLGILSKRNDSKTSSKMKRIVGIILLIVIQTSFANATKFTERSKEDYVNIDVIDRTAYSTIVIRKSRQTDSNDPLNQGTDRLRNQITNFSDSFRKESNTSNSTLNYRPDSNSKIANLENEIQKVKEEIEQLKNAPSVDSSSKIKFSSLESAIETLQKLFDDNKKLSESQMGNLESIIESLTASVSEYRRELEKIKKLMDEKDKIEKERQMPAEIVQDIRDGEHNIALRKLLSLPGAFRRNAEHVVRAANINQGKNFADMRRFANSLHRDSERTLRFYQVLREEMENVHFNDVVEMLRLVESANNTLVRNYQDDVPSHIRKEAKIFVDNLQSTTRDIASRKLEDAMITDSYRSVSDLCNDITSEYPIQFREIMKKTINNVINKISADKLVNFMLEHNFISQRIFGYSTIFNEMKSRNRLNDPAVVFLAYGLKNLMGMNTYQYTSTEASIAAEEVKNALSKSVKNLAFSKRVCIKNRDRQEQLFAGDYQSFDESRRRVSTWRKGTRVDRDEWVVFPVEYVFFIKSYSLGEYLYAADDNHKLDQSRRRVLTWIPGDRVKQGRWSIEPNGDDVYIKNYIHNEYLYADDYIVYSDERRVYTWGSGSKPSHSLWTIEDCG